MKPSLIANHLLESDDFDPLDYLKSGGNESAIEVYDGPIVRITSPLTVFTLNDYLLNNEWSEQVFDAQTSEGPIFMVLDKGNHENMALIQPSRREAWNLHGRSIDWRDVKDALGEEAYQDMQTGLANYFLSQIAAKKNVSLNVSNLAMIGRSDLAANYPRYLGRAKLPLANQIDAVMAMNKAGKRSRNKIASLMKNQDNVKWGERGFWLLFDDWQGLAPFYGESRNYDYAKNAEKLFGGDARDWWDHSEEDPEEAFDSLNDSNLRIIRQLLYNRTLANDAGEEFVATKEMIDDLSDSEIKDLIFDSQNDSETDDIKQAIRWAASDAYAPSQESAYYEGYQKALASDWSLSLEKDVKWIQVPNPKKKGEKKEMLGIYFPYSVLEEWIKQWKEDEYEEDFYGDIHDLAKAYLPKVMPNEDYWGDRDTDYFNEQAQYHLSEIDMRPTPEQADPNQPELPLQGEPERATPELETTKSVVLGNNLTNQTVYKGVPSGEASKYAKAMNYKAGDRDIYLRAESFLAIPLSRIDEAAGDITIEFEASDEAAESLVPLLKELKKMGSQGSSRNIKIEDWDGRDSFDFDGDGASKIGTIKVAGKVVEGLIHEVEDPKDLAMSVPAAEWVIKLDWREGTAPQNSSPWYYRSDDMSGGYTLYPQDAKIFSYEEAQAELERLRNQRYTPDDPNREQLSVVPFYRDDLGESLLQEAVYKLSTTQIDLPKEIGQQIISWGELNIADDDLYVEEDGGCGRETEQHCTVLYGLTDQQPSEALRQIVKHTKPFLIELGGISIFENPKFDVVKLDVISEELHNLHYELRRSCPNENKYPDYKPHVTVAYVKPGVGKKYAQMDPFKVAQVPRDFWAYELLFKGAGDSEDGNRVVELIPFDKSKDFAPEEPEAGETRYPLAVKENIDPVDPKALAMSIPVERGPVCECVDPGCPHCAGNCEDRGTIRVYRVDMEDESGSLLCEKCADDCFESGLFTTKDDYGDDEPEEPLDESEQVDPKDYVTTDYVIRRNLADGTVAYWKRRTKSWTRNEDEGSSFFDTASAEAVLPYTIKAEQDTVEVVPRSSVKPPVAENHVDPKAFVDKVSRPATAGCPGCKSTNLSEPDDEGLIDCLDCGIWFDPQHPENALKENAEVKDFLDRQLCTIRMGTGAATRYLAKNPDGTFRWHDYDQAALFDQDEAEYIIAYVIGGENYGGQPVRIELRESSEVDPKQFAMNLPTQVQIKFKHPAGVDAYYSGMGMEWYRDREDARKYSPEEADQVLAILTRDNYMPDELEIVPVLESSVDPKEFAMDVPPADYWVIVGQGMAGQKLYYQNRSLVYGAAGRWQPYKEDAYQFPDMNSAMEKANTLDGTVGVEPVFLQESEVDPKEFAMQTSPHHELQQWDEAGPDGGYKCSCGGWRYKLTVWSSSIQNAMKEFRAHKRAAAKASPQQESEVDVKEFAMSVPNQYVVRSDHTPPEYLAIGLPDDKTYVYQTSDRTQAKIFSATEAEDWAEHLSSPHRTNPNKPRPTWTAVPVDVNESTATPFEADGLPGEATSFLRKVRSRRPPKKPVPPVI